MRNIDTNEIPKWGWLNALFMFNFSDELEKSPDTTIKDLHNTFSKNNVNGENFQLKNQGVVISSLYMLLVVPRELQKKYINTPSFQFESRKYFNFVKGENLSTNDFIRNMRNAVAHADFTIDINGKYSFFNINSRGTVTMEVTIMHTDIGHFLTEIGKYYINENPMNPQ